MSGQGIAQILVYAVVLIALAYPLGLYMARVYGEPGRAPRWLGGVESGFYRLVRTDPKREQDWKSYGETRARLQRRLLGRALRDPAAAGPPVPEPGPPAGRPSHIALNTTASFVTNTNWQYYGGEYTMSYLTQMAGLAVQNFVSAAVGMAVLVAVVRGVARRSSKELGNFWVDLYRSLVYILLPLALVLAVILISQGVPQTFDGHATATTLEGAAQTIARGPVASHDRDQAARDERRRLLQLELGRAVREPERAHELPRDARDPAHPGGAGLHVREDGARAPARAGWCFARDARDLRDRRRRRLPGRAARLAGAARLGREHRPGQRPDAAAT